MNVPVNTPLLGGNEKKYLDKCIDTGWISSEGPFVKRFEQDFAERIGVGLPGIAVCNGTAALEAALYALGVGDGDEVIMPSFTIVSCALACLRLGAVPVLVDVDPIYWCMNTEQIESRITERTKVIMAVHIYGSSVNMQPLLGLKKKYNLLILEDMAEAIGSQYINPETGVFKNCGTIGDVAAVSFYANKLITTGEGGMVLTSDETIFERARQYRNLCFGRKERFRHEDIGYNFRMTNLQAAVGVAQLEQMDDFLAIKARNGKYYAEFIRNLPDIRFMHFPEWTNGVFWMYAVELAHDKGKTAIEIMEKLGQMGVGTRPFFLGLHDQDILRGKISAIDGAFPVSDEAYKYGFYLPSGMNLNFEQIEYVCNCLREILA